MIVVVRVGYEAPATVPGDQVREQLRKSGAILYVVSSVGAQRAPPSQARPGISAEQAQLRADEDADGALDLGQVLGDGSRESGGRHEQIVSTTLVPALEQVAAELLNQYAITFVRPAGGKPGDKLSVSSKRKGVTIRAPSRLPYLTRLRPFDVRGEGLDHVLRRGDRVLRRTAIELDRVDSPVPDASVALMSGTTS